MYTCNVHTCIAPACSVYLAIVTVPEFFACAIYALRSLAGLGCRAPTGPACAIDAWVPGRWSGVTVLK